MSSLTSTRFETFFSGSEIVVCGQLSDNVTGKDLHYTVTGKSPNAVKKFLPQNEPVVVGDHGIENKPGLLERTWAYLRIRQILEGGHCMCGKKQEAIQMALKVFVFVLVLMGWSFLPNALRPFKIYCAPPNLGIRT